MFIHFQQVWNIDSFELMDTISGHDQPVCTLGVAGDILLSGSLKVIKVRLEMENICRLKRSSVCLSTKIRRTKKHSSYFNWFLKYSMFCFLLFLYLVIVYIKLSNFIKLITNSGWYSIHRNTFNLQRHQLSFLPSTDFR